MKPLTLLPNGKVSNPEKADEALAYVQDLMQRSQIPFIVLREAALQLFLYQEIIKSYDITIAVRPQYMVDSCISILESILPTNYEKTAKGYNFVYEEEMPCHIRIINKPFKFLLDPDRRTFGYGYVYIPNPFERYWKDRSFV